MFVIYIVSKKNNVFHFHLGAYVKVKSSDSKDDPHFFPRITEGIETPLVYVPYKVLTKICYFGAS
jgi:hypothetical protein